MRAFRPSKSPDSFAQRVLAMLKETGPANVQQFRVFAANATVFHAGVGLMFIRGQVRFTGARKGRKLATARRDSSPEKVQRGNRLVRSAP
jgi:hypothetical protein